MITAPIVISPEEVNAFEEACKRHEIKPDFLQNVEGCKLAYSLEHSYSGQLFYLGSSFQIIKERDIAIAKI